jgi:type I restriction enzyme, S subunit
VKELALGEICEINPRLPRAQSKNVECSFVPMEYVNEVTGTVSRTDIRLVNEVQKGYTYFAENDVLFAKITPCMENGKCAIARNLVNGLGFGSTEFHVLRAGPQTIPEWIYYYLRQASTRSRAEERMTGSAGQKRVPGSVLEEELFISLPPLPEQRRIAAMLARADRLRRLRRYALEVSERHLQEMFFDMFNAELKTSGNSEQLGNLVTITGGGTPSRSVPSYFTGHIPWLTAKDMKGEYIYDTEEHVTEQAVANSATKIVPPRSILIVVKSKILAHRLPLAVSMAPMCHGQDIKSIQCSSKILPEFVVQILRYNESRLLEQARGANTEGLTLPMLEEILVPQVSLERQRQFAQVTTGHRYLRAQQREALRQANQLLDTLLHKAFRGELSTKDEAAVEALAAVPADEAGEARQMRLAME